MNMKYIGEFPRLVRGASVAALTTLTLTACFGSQNESAQSAVCRTATIKMGDGAFNALKRELKEQVFISAPVALEGFNTAYMAAAEDLRNLRDGGEAQPGDSFMFCGNGEQVSYQPDSAALAKD